MNERHIVGASPQSDIRRIPLSPLCSSRFRLLAFKALRSETSAPFLVCLCCATKQRDYEPCLKTLQRAFRASRNYSYTSQALSTRDGGEVSSSRFKPRAPGNTAMEIAQCQCPRLRRRHLPLLLRICNQVYLTSGETGSDMTARPSSTSFSPCLRMSCKTFSKLDHRCHLQA